MSLKNSKILHKFWFMGKKRTALDPVLELPSPVGAVNLSLRGALSLLRAFA